MSHDLDRFLPTRLISIKPPDESRGPSCWSIAELVQDKAIAEAELLLLIVADQFEPTTTRMLLIRVFIHTVGLADV
ncbi:hypothetical protein NKH24_20290 [Mesorhizobium sp. M1300]|uniref:hypothetical protein n=1 Tax=Mesorhizobium sp. M1300 TaxID=2957077 RepID=UPI00333C3BED